MTPPAVVNQTTSVNTAAASQTVTLPGSVVAGNMLLCVTATNGTATTSTSSSGWQKIGQTTNTAGSTYGSLSMFMKIATSSNSLVLTQSSSQASTSIIYQISGVSTSLSAANLNYSFVAYNNSAVPDPPQVNGEGVPQGGWDWLGIAALSLGGGGSAIAGYPSGFSGGTRSTTGSGTTAQAVGAAWIQLTGASGVNPGAFTATNDYGVVGTLLIPGTSGPAATPTRKRGSFHHLVGAA